MIKKLSSLALLLLVLCLAATAQELGTWRSYLSYQIATKSEVNGSIIYSLMNGNLLSYDTEDGEVRTFDHERLPLGSCGLDNRDELIVAQQIQINLTILLAKALIARCLARRAIEGPHGTRSTRGRVIILVPRGHDCGTPGHARGGHRRAVHVVIRGKTTVVPSTDGNLIEIQAAIHYFIRAVFPVVKLERNLQMETHLPTHNLIREVMLQRIWLGDVQTEKVPTVARGAEVLRVDHAVDRVQIGSILELDGTLDIMPQLKIPGIEGKADILHLIRVQVSDGNVNVEIRGRLSPRGDGYFEGLSVTIEAYVSHGDAINPCRPAFFRNNLTLAVLTKVIPSCRVIERIAIGIGM